MVAKWALKKGWWWCAAVTQLERLPLFNTFIVSLLAPRRDKQSFCLSCFY
jgi:hypothetical protein